MVDFAEDPRSIDVAEELKDSFLGAYFWHLEEMEFTPGFVLSAESAAAADLFEALHDSFDEVPQDLVASTEQLFASMPRMDFDKALDDAIVAVGRRSFPKSAAEFLTALNFTLAECAAER